MTATPQVTLPAAARRGVSAERIRIVLLALAIAAFAVHALSASGGSDTRSRTPPKAPRLSHVLALGSVRCAARGSAAAARGLEREARGLALWQRAPYAAHDAVLALQALDEAAACYAEAARRDDSSRIAALSTRWSSGLAEAYERDVVLLGIALRRERTSEVMRYAAKLREYLEGATAEARPYVDWLEQVEREASVRARTEKAE